MILEAGLGIEILKNRSLYRFLPICSNIRSMHRTYRGGPYRASKIDREGGESTTEEGRPSALGALNKERELEITSDKTVSVSA
jgi:hypothetical protein